MTRTNAPSRAEPEFLPTRCAICGTTGPATEVYPAKLNAEAFSARVFSARRSPDRVHYRIVRCNTCGLLRSDPVASPDVLRQLYAESSFTYDAEVESLTRTYGRYLAELELLGTPKGDLLEIGCGNGFFLVEAQRQGYRRVVGVEPSADAARKAPWGIDVVVDIMRPGLFPPSSFDVVCMFQVLDHLSDPSGVLRECCTVLRPGGVILCFNHDAGAVSARLMRERSPIVDVEHTFLFDQRGMARILSGAGFEVVTVASAMNLYPLRYLVHLTPLPRPAKRALASALEWTRLGTLRSWLPIGNLYALGRRPPA